MSLVLLANRSLKQLIFLKELLKDDALNFRLATTEEMAQDLLEVESFELVITEDKMNLEQIRRISKPLPLIELSLLRLNKKHPSIQIKIQGTFQSITAQEFRQKILTLID